MDFELNALDSNVSAIPPFPGMPEDVEIESIVRRAREIHRRHGGIFGYDYEDWTQAWMESGGRPNLQLSSENGLELMLGREGEVLTSCFRFDN